MRYYPESEADLKDLKSLNAEAWQVEVLKKNPNYCSWGNFEDYMWNDHEGWDSPKKYDSIKDGLWHLDDLNEVVNFYFTLERANEKCSDCDGSGYNEETKKIADDWYDFANTGRKWCSNITEVEIEALVRGGRLWDFFKEKHRYNDEIKRWEKLVDGEWAKCKKPTMPTPTEVNEWSKKTMGHDAINRWICIEARTKHLGIYGVCPKCQGNGIIYTEPKAKLALQLWVLHPRKGASRGVYISEIKQEELPEVIAYLKQAAERNAQRFSKL